MSEERGSCSVKHSLAQELHGQWLFLDVKASVLALQ